MLETLDNRQSFPALAVWTLHHPHIFVLAGEGGALVFHIVPLYVMTFESHSFPPHTSDVIDISRLPV